jgi:ribosomal protein L11 methyltransferase
VIRLAVRVRRERAELALAELLQLAPGGLEEVDRGETVEYALYGAPGELPRLPALRAAIGGTLVEVDTSEVPDDWQERWKRFHRPVTIAGPGGEGPVALRVRAPWERPAEAAAGPQADAPGREGAAATREAAATHEIVIDPGQAFGTGSHATTRLCLQLLLERAAEGDRGALIDIGTGSGVLAIAAAKLGFGPVAACDHDPASVEAAAENAAVNGVEIDVSRHDLRRGAPPACEDATVLANLLRPLLLELCEELRSPPAHLIASGLLEGEVEEVAAAFARAHGLLERARAAEGEWAAVWLAGAERAGGGGRSVSRARRSR